MPRRGVTKGRRCIAHGDPEHAELERRNVEIERALARLERDRADFQKAQARSALTSTL
jgi:hypothetical protein